MPDRHRKAHNMVSTFVDLDNNSNAHLIQVTDTFWPDLISGALNLSENGRLISAVAFDADFAQWECHPEGDELVYLISGAIDFVLEDSEESNGARSVEMRTPGDFVHVPKGVWHTVKVKEPGKALFITAGEGTMHRRA